VLAERSLDGVVHSQWTRQNGTLALVVQGDGSGISTTWFVPFFTRTPWGSGVGLMRCRHIAEAHTDSLSLENHGLEEIRIGGGSRAVYLSAPNAAAVCAMRVLYILRPWTPRGARPRPPLNRRSISTVLKISDSPDVARHAVCLRPVSECRDEVRRPKSRTYCRTLRPVVVRGGNARTTPKGEPMTFRISSRTIFGAAALLSFGASFAVAQDTTRTRSQRRIPISKEAPGEVVRVDTVMIYRTDTLTMTTLRVDTLRTTHTVYRTDTLIKYPNRGIHGGFYVGLAGGVSAPAGALFTPNSAGPSGQFQVGWQGAKQVLGGRLDLNYAHPGEDSRFSAFQGDAQAWSWSANLKAQLPWFTRIMGGFGRFALYGIGGYTGTSFRNLPMRINSSCVNFANGTNVNPLNGQVINGQVVNINNANINCTNFNNVNGVTTVNGITTVNGVTFLNGVAVSNNGEIPVFVTGVDNWHYESGWNAGGGASLQFSRTELFIESRVIGFHVSNAPQSRLIPTVFGINMY
jgi:hypothetical protein